MQKKVLLRTARKLASFFGSIIFVVGGIFVSSWAGHYFLGNELIGNGIFLGLGGIGFVTYFAYKESKSEVDLENKMLMRELTKHG